MALASDRPVIEIFAERLGRAAHVSTPMQPLENGISLCNPPTPRLVARASRA
jgi:hypothetical protein